MSKKTGLWQSLNRTRHLPPAFISFFLTAVSIGSVIGMGWGLWKMGAYNPVGNKITNTKADDNIGMRFFNVTIQGRKEGTPFFTIIADKIKLNKDLNYVTFETGKKKPHGQFYNMKDWEDDKKDTSEGPEKKRDVTWESDLAFYDMSTENLRMVDNVILITDAEDTVYTDEMMWNKSTESLSSTKRTKIHTHHDTYMVADNVDVKTRDKEMYLEGHVYIEMDVNSDQKIQIKEEDDDEG